MGRPGQLLHDVALDGHAHRADGGARATPARHLPRGRVHRRRSRRRRRDRGRSRRSALRAAGMARRSLAHLSSGWLPLRALATARLPRLYRLALEGQRLRRPPPRRSTRDDHRKHGVRRLPRAGADRGAERQSDRAAARLRREEARAALPRPPGGVEHRLRRRSRSCPARDYHRARGEMNMQQVLMAILLLALPEPRLGTITFPNSGKPEAQAAFLPGVALLPNFAYPQAAKAFQEAETIDPNFALAYWGEAMTHNHPLWYQYDKAGGRAALAKLTKRPADARERGYIDAVEALYADGVENPSPMYEKAMERLARANPDDVEAQAFWALSILGTRGRNESDSRKQIRAAAVLEPLFAAHPDHPGVLHYLIHAYDDPVHAPLGLRAARRYSRVASDAPHALHMPSHIFLQLGMWDDAAHSNEAAYALSKQWSEPDYHSLEWLQYVYLQQGRFAEAKKLVGETATGQGERYHHARSNM